MEKLRDIIAPNGASHDIDIVLTKMTGFCQGVVNETYERYLFNTRSQGENESVDEFYSALLALSKNCSFVIVGIQDNSTRQRLLSEKELSLQKRTYGNCSFV